MKRGHVPEKVRVPSESGFGYFKVNFTVTVNMTSFARPSWMKGSYFHCLTAAMAASLSFSFPLLRTITWLTLPCVSILALRTTTPLICSFLASSG